MAYLSKASPILINHQPSYNEVNQSHHIEAFGQSSSIGIEPLKLSLPHLINAFKNIGSQIPSLDGGDEAMGRWTVSFFHSG